MSVATDEPDNVAMAMVVATEEPNNVEPVVGVLTGACSFDL